MKKLFGVIAAVFIVAGVYAQSGPEIVRLDSLGSARYDADFVSIFDVDDFTNTNANPTVAVTSSVPAKTVLRLSGAVLKQAFDDGLTTRTNSVALTIGDGSDADLFLTSTELAADGTEVWVNFAPVGSVNIGATGEVTAVTANGVKYYASAGSVVYTFTCTDATYPSDFTAGKLEVYWRELK